MQLYVAGAIDDDALLDELKLLPGWSRVEFAGWVEQSVVYRRMVDSKIGLATISSDKYHLDFSANKVFDYMMAGIPQIVTPARSWSEIINKHECGLVLADDSPESFAEAINYLLRNEDEAKKMGENGRRAVLENYSWESEERKLVALYERLIGKP
ncbi:MAG: glycosyltransferase [Armatimonadetes bacterium]|nr:glycosyltransferase [Armatimonadota bacterium]